MRTLICGSIAFDQIMVFRDQFKNHILPGQIHTLNVSFLVPEMRREFGGCAGNIAYNLKLLGGEPVIMATVGDDAGPYLTRFDALGINRQHVRHIPNTFTAQAFITTDIDDNQITAFHPGAMGYSDRNKVADAQNIGLAIVAPDGKDAMLAHSRALAKAGTPFIFDLGQAMPLFNGMELLEMLDIATYAAFNDYEAKVVMERTGLTATQLAERVDALIITHGGEGSEIHAGGQVHHIPAAEADQIADPTGCGDAYRAGLLYGIANGYDWPTTGRLASVMGAIKIGHRGCQNHAPSRDEIAQRYARAYGNRPW